MGRAVGSRRGHRSARPDAFRYFLLREVPWDGDGGFTYERFDERYTSELANDLGNLANRSLAMLAKYRDGRVPEAAPTSMDAFVDDAVSRYIDRMDRLLLHEGAAAAFSMVSEANSFIVQNEPWKLARDAERAADLDGVLTSLVRVLATVSVLLSPFMPEKMLALWERLGSGGDMPSLQTLTELDHRPAGQPRRGRFSSRGRSLWRRSEVLPG
jgi:methionyl-tRNA synthetase